MACSHSKHGCLLETETVHRFSLEYIVVFQNAFDCPSEAPEFVSP